MAIYHATSIILIHIIIKLKKIKFKLINFESKDKTKKCLVKMCYIYNDVIRLILDIDCSYIKDFIIK